MKKQYKYNIESIKIPAATLRNGDLEALLKAAKAINETRTHCFPSDVYVHPADSRRIQAAIKRALRKKYRYLKGKRLEFSVGMYWLNLGPNESKATTKGRALVDRKSIENEKQRFAPNEPGLIPEPAVKS